MCSVQMVGEDGSSEDEDMEDVAAAPSDIPQQNHREMHPSNKS